MRIDASLAIARRFSRMTRKLKELYGDRLPEGVTQHLNASEGLTQTERYSLDAEVDICRLVLAETLRIFEAAQKSSDSDTRASAIVQTRGALEFAMTRIDAAARLRIDRGDAVEEESKDQLLEELVEQLMRHGVPRETIDAAKASVRMPAQSGKRITVRIA